MLKIFLFIVLVVCGCDFHEKSYSSEDINVSLIDTGVDSYFLRLSGVNSDFKLSLDKDAGKMPVYFDKFKSNICGVERFVVVVSSDAGGPITSGALFYYLIIDFESKVLLNEIVAGEVIDRESGVVISSEKASAEFKLKSGSFCFK